MLHVTCPHCNSLLQSNNSPGESIQCGYCLTVFEIPRKPVTSEDILESLEQISAEIAAHKSQRAPVQFHHWCARHVPIVSELSAPVFWVITISVLLVSAGGGIGLILDSWGRMGGLIFGLALLFPPIFMLCWFVRSAYQEGRDLNVSLDQKITNLKESRAEWRGRLQESRALERKELHKENVRRWREHPEQEPQPLRRMVVVSCPVAWLVAVIIIMVVGSNEQFKNDAVRALAANPACIALVAIPACIALVLTVMALTGIAQRCRSCRWWWMQGYLNRKLLSKERDLQDGDTVGPVHIFWLYWRLRIRRRVVSGQHIRIRDYGTPGANRCAAAVLRRSLPL